VTDGAAPRRPGRRSAVIGAGIVGLSVAWFLQEQGFDVTIFDRRGVAAGASAGNMGWITPAMVAPLPEPAVLRYALRSLLERDSPLRIPPTALPRALRFLAAFATHCTQRQWLAGAASFTEIGAQAQDAYDQLAKAGVTATVSEAPLFLAFEHSEQAAPVRHELEVLTDHGLHYRVSELDENELRRAQPILSDRARYGMRLDGQRYLQPLEYVQSLAASVRARGGSIKADAAVTGVSSTPGGGIGLEFSGPEGTAAAFDVAVLASGAWLGQLGRPMGVRVPVTAGRGYSFSVRTDEPVRSPLYLPAQRVAGTPTADGLRLRLGGTMEFRPPDAPLDKRRIQAIVRSVRDYLSGADWSTMADSWVGARPVTADGLPLIGATRLPGLFVAGGHGMWGVTLGPATGRLLAELIATGRQPEALSHFDPCR
jgi:D-amino-acid dehydrogenase